MTIKIMLDAGHYINYNPSTIYPKYKEGTMTWRLQKYLKKELEEYGFIVGTTRTDGYVDTEVYSRGIRAKGYDVFLSLHSSTCGDKNVDKITVIKGHDQPDGISVNLAKELTKTMEVDQEYEIITKITKNGNEYYGVLRGAKSAGVKDRYIVEYGFHTNSNTARWLCEIENIKKIASTTAKVLANHYGYKKKTILTRDSSSNNIKWSKPKVTWRDGDYGLKARTLANVNLRKGRGTNYDVIQVIPKGTIFNLEYVNNNWGSTWDFNDEVGYLCCEYIEIFLK